MARTPTSTVRPRQFFINLKDNDFLDHKVDTIPAFGYCVFGR